MSRKSKYTASQKTKAVQDYLDGVRSVAQICLDLEVKSIRTIRQWISVYQVSGVLAFALKQGNSTYLKELKAKLLENT